MNSVNRWRFSFDKSKIYISIIDKDFSIKKAIAKNWLGIWSPHCKKCKKRHLFT